MLISKSIKSLNKLHGVSHCLVECFCWMMIMVARSAYLQRLQISVHSSLLEFIHSRSLYFYSVGVKCVWGIVRNQFELASISNNKVKYERKAISVNRWKEGKGIFRRKWNSKRVLHKSSDFVIGNQASIHLDYALNIKWFWPSCTWLEVFRGKQCSESQKKVSQEYNSENKKSQNQIQKALYRKLNLNYISLGSREWLNNFEQVVS